MVGSVLRCLGLVALLPLGAGIAVADPLPTPLPTLAPTKAPSQAAAPSGAPASPGSQVVAEVDGRPVTLADVGDAIRALPPSMAALPLDVLFPAVRDQLVTEQAVVNRAHQAGLDDDPAVRRRMRAAADRVLADAFVQRAADATVTEAALLARYAETVAGKPGPLEIHARAIMVPTEAQAAAVLGELHGGAEFATLARRASKDPTAGAGGDLGWVTRDRLSPEIGAVAFSLAVGELPAYPVQSVAGWFILKVEARRHAPTPSFAEARERLRAELASAAMPAVTAAAMKGAVVREYTLTGKEVTESEGKSPESRP